MKKIITILFITMMVLTFTSCEKEEVEKEINYNNYSYTMRCSKCGAGLHDLKIFYPPSFLENAVPTYTCLICGHSDKFIKVYN